MELLTTFSDFLRFWGAPRLAFGTIFLVFSTDFLSSELIDLEELWARVGGRGGGCLNLQILKL